MVSTGSKCDGDDVVDIREWSWVQILIWFSFTVGDMGWLDDEGIVRQFVINDFIWRIVGELGDTT